MYGYDWTALSMGLPLHDPYAIRGSGGMGLGHQQREEMHRRR